MSTLLETTVQKFLNPTKVYSHTEIFAANSPIPKEGGVYGLHFRNMPEFVPVGDCTKFDNLYMLHVGISPEKPKKGKGPSSENMYKRIRNHYTKTAEGSTLRFSLGCVLQKALDIRLRLIGKSRTFGDGEKKLSLWMSENVFVSWLVDSEPWLVVEGVIERTSLPLNIQNNSSNSFVTILKDMRSRARESC